MVAVDAAIKWEVSAAIASVPMVSWPGATDVSMSTNASRAPVEMARPAPTCLAHSSAIATCKRVINASYMQIWNSKFGFMKILYTGGWSKWDKKTLTPYQQK